MVIYDLRDFCSNLIVQGGEDVRVGFIEKW